MAERGDIEHYRNAIGEVFAGRRVIVVGGPVDRLLPLARDLRALGADRPFIIGSSLGTGELPSEDEAEWVSLEVGASSLLEARRVYEGLLAHLPESVRQRLDDWDPRRSAIALGAFVLGEVPQVGGRPRYAARPRAWTALEDKTTIDGLWDSLGIEHAPFAVVRPNRAELEEAASRLDGGMGTVWAADSRDGINSGADAVRWIQNERDVRDALEFFPTRCERVRVTPFMEGVPCSIHGIVVPDGVAVFRPVELLTLRERSESHIAYAGTATYWDPPARDREVLRALAHRAGEAIARRVGFRGAFTIDGVLAEQGFLPTELNPRIGTGLALLDKSTAGLPLTLVAIAAQAGENLDFRPQLLEELVVESADERRGGSAFLMLHQPHKSRRSLRVVWSGDEFSSATDDLVDDGEVSIGPSEVGSFVRYAPRPERVPVGPPFAPRVAAAFRLAERELGTRGGRLESARAVRAG